MPDLPPLPADIPHQPKLTYKHHGWSGGHDWLGLPRKQRFRVFPSARVIARTVARGIPPSQP